MLRRSVAVLLALSAALAVPLDTSTQSLVLTTPAVTPTTPGPGTPSSSMTQKPEKAPATQINAFNVVSNIRYRYADTVVSSRVKNPAEVPQTAAFSVVLPETAFISGFLMEIDGKVYKAHVKEKEEAKKEYNAAVQAGQAAGHVAVSARDSNRFTVDVSVPALQKATFNLTYEELLTRKIGVYNHVLNLHPGQVVKDMTVDVYINENRPITTLRVPELRSGNEVSPDETDPNNSVAQITKDDQDKTKAHISFAPTPDEQRSLMEQLIEKDKKEDETSFHPFGTDKVPDISNQGIKGQFVVQYDVERDSQGGEVMVYDGYFVHFLAPDDLKPLPKHVVFVLDTSGSMHGRKIEQLRTAMTSILSDLKPEDFFHIINFSFAAKVWDLDDPEKSPSYSSPNVHWWGPAEETIDKNTPPPAAYPASADYVKKAKDQVEKLEANGGTNIYDSLEIAMKVANRGVEKKDTSSGKPQPEPMIIFLTDGDPTVGETDLNKIYTMVDESKISDKPPTMFSLAFGDDADRNFLRKLSLRNGGFLRHIYEAGDSSKQLQNFYREVSSPLLTGVKFIYPKEQVDEESLTRRQFPLLFGGSELVVAGRLAQPDLSSVEPKVEAISVLGPWSTTGVVLPPISPVPSDHKPAPLERLWAYLRIKQLLDEKDSEVVASPDPAAEDRPHAEPSGLVPKPETAKDKALKLALKYSFVTPLTSLVVVKPNASDSSVDTETAKPGSNGGHALPLSLGAPGASAIPGLRANAIGGHYTQFQMRIGSFSPKRKLATNSYIAALPAFPSFGAPASGFQAVPMFSRVPASSGPFDRADAMVHEEHEAQVAQTTPLLVSTTDSAVPAELSGFPWLAAHLQDGQLRLDVNGTQHTLNLTSNELADQPECPNAINGAGKCVPLARCPGAKYQVTDLQTYKQYFCTVEGYAAICCDDRNRLHGAP